MGDVYMKMNEYTNKCAELNSLFVPLTTDLCLARILSSSFKQVSSFEIKNTGRGTITVTLKKRGETTTVTAANKNALRVDSTDRFRGNLGARRLTPKTVIIVDTNVVIPQRVEDTNGDGILWQTAGPVGPTYPVQVGTVDYNEGIIDFTFYATVTLAVTADYKQTDWASFSTPVTFDVAPGGGVYPYIIYPTNAENYMDSVKNADEIGFFAKRKSASDVASSINLSVGYFGDDSNISSQIVRGEITGYPYHNN